ncbi:uncharacterized protein [Acropora muricata]|uniref:uncharacterized protein isoform X3 n=1 Tax=Acropora muricata TaxID=159855 RepID=UPI0034E514CC
MDGPSRSWQPTSRPNDSSFGERMTSYNSQRNPKFASTRTPQYEECKVYVKNVPADMTRESFEALFRNCGNVLSVHILEPKEGRNSTIGFVKYASDEEVMKAIERFNGTQLGQSVLVVERAVQKDRDRNTTTNQEQGYYPKGDLQGIPGNQYDSPSFQGYRAQNDHSQRDYPRQTLNAPETNNNHFGMGNRQEEAIFNPRGPGRGEPPRVGNMGQQSNYYSGQVVNGGEVAVNNSQGTGVGYEQAVFNPRGPGRGGIQNSHLQPYQQATYRQPYELSNQPAAMGVRVEEAVFNPRGPGRGGGMVPQSVPSYSPGRNSGFMNGSHNDSSYSQGNHTSWMSDGHQQHTTHIADDLHQEINVTGRLSQASSPQDTRHMTNGPQTSETGYFARESPNQSPQRREKGGHNGYKRGEAGHFAREYPNQEEEGGEPVKRMPPVTYIPPELPRDIDELFRDAPHSGLNFEKYDSIPVIVTGKDKPPPIETFEQAGILDQCATNIRRAQFTKPTPIQKYAIPITLAGRDLMACAQTGSGKTVAYLLPVLTGMIKRGLLDSGSYLSGGTQSPAALCLAPTRELAVQIHKEVCKFAYDTVVQAKVCYGGVSVLHQLDKIQRGCHFLIATPGRLIDFVERSRISLANVQYLILDEADRMLDMGFEGDVRKIVEKLGMPDKMSRQTLMFSATFPDEIQRLAADFLKESYLFVAVGTVGGSNLDISQTVISVAGDDKQEKLFDILLHSGTDRTLIFVELKRVADFLACLLSQNKFPTTSISGDRTQQEREAALLDFRTGRAPVLVATSVAARGLDIADVKHVINYDLPQDIDEYVHRIGRTGRIGNKGKATSFFQPDRDEKLARSLVKVLSQAYQEVPEWLEQVAEEAVGSSYGPAGGRFASKDRREMSSPTCDSDYKYVATAEVESFVERCMLAVEKYDSIPVIVTGKDKPPPIETFELAGILDQCATNIRRAQFTKPTPIQKYAIPITLAGRDLMACAQTGSGKTVAYLLPVLTGMIKRGLLDSGSYLSGGTQSPAALCLAPTRELAVQIHKEVCKFAYDTVVQAKVCYGGVSVQHQLDKIQRGCHFLIATPGRLIDFVERSRISLANVQYLILDEADRMLDMGFEVDVRKIVEKLGMPDKMSRQTLMFSATFPDEIQRLAADFLKESYLFVAVGTVGGSNLDISQTVISVAGDDKQEKLFDVLLHSGTDRTLIFVELKRVADFLACLLSQNKFPTTSISGDRTQQERDAALHDFRTGRAPVLVATSVAARGLDIADVKHVINYDLPQDIDEYVHRIGRTGRIGNKGKATSFFQPDRDEKLARSLVKVLSQAYQEVPEWLEQVAEEAVGSSYGPAGGRFASKDRREMSSPTCDSDYKYVATAEVESFVERCMLAVEKYDSIPVIVTGKDKPPPIETFELAGILDQCATNIRRAQFTKPTPIQKYAIPITLAGRDLMACAQTGSGKTVAYLLPVLTGMIKRGLLDSGSYLSGGTQSPAALCLAPTRELAVQIHKEVCKFAYDTVVQAKVCYGGVSVQHQLDKIQRGCHFLIATPGRLIDFVERSRISLANVQYLILDEADRMLDMGFEVDVRKIVEKLGMPDKMSRQTLMFSATFPDEIQRLAADFLKESYLFVAVGTVGGSNLDISQTVISVAGDDKQEKLFDVLLHSGTDRTLIFVELKRVADFLACLLSQNKFPTTSISGDRTQQEREAALLDFRTGRAPVLVATSVAARGLDIADVKHVINYDLPQDIDEYVHRIGRTGRIGNKGKATSFFQPDRDEKLARSLVKVLSQAYQEVPEWLEQVAEEAVGSSYGPAGGRFASKDRRERDRPRGSAHVQPQMSAFTNGMNAVTKRLEQTSIQPVSVPTECTEDGEDWD